MKGVQAMSVANSSSKRFQANDIHAERIHISGVEVGSTVTRLMDSINNLNDKVKQLETKLNNFEEVEEVEEDK